MFELILLLLIILNVEAVTNILSKSELFQPLRKFLFNLYNSRGIKLSGFVHDLLDCPYCTSVWVSAFYVLCLYLSSIYPLFLTSFTYFCIIITFHRLSNILHYIMDRFDSNRTDGQG